MHALPRQDDLTGAHVEGRYRLVRRLGKGACGSVYEGESLMPALADHGKRRVAVKILGKRHGADAESLARFTREAFLGAKLRGKNIARVVDFGHLDDGRPWFAMELVKGATLDRILGQIGIVPRALAIEIIEQTATALSLLHKHGVVHRDVKPSNILVDLRPGRQVRVRLIDLGVAGIFDGRRARKLGARGTKATGSHGTPAYIAPEQALGLPVDGRADVYALGCVAYRMLTGIDPLRGSSVDVTVQMHLFEVARPASALNPALPTAVDDVLARALEKAPDARTPDVIRLAAELRAALS